MQSKPSCKKSDGFCFLLKKETDTYAFDYQFYLLPCCIGWCWHDLCDDEGSACDSFLDCCPAFDILAILFTREALYKYEMRNALQQLHASSP